MAHHPNGEAGGALFDTAIGQCCIAWSADGITRVRLLGAASIDGNAPGDLPPVVQQAIGRIQALLNGEPSDLSSIPLDETGVPEFHRRVYDVARRIPAGSTRTYGDIAAELGDPGAARAVGQALGRNPWPLIVPCHRVLAAGGKAGGFSAPGGTATKMRLLAIEGAARAGTLPLF